MKFGEYPIRKFGTLASTVDSVDMGGSLLTATNAILRPEGAVRGPMAYDRLWALGSDQSAVSVTVDDATDVFTRSAHGLVIGAVLRFSSTLTLPAPLVVNTDYYVESIPTSSTFKVSATLGGSAINITTPGTGTISYIATITIQALYRSLTFSGYASGVGVDGAARSANKTIAVRHVRQGKHFLALYDLISSEGRGLFYLGDDGTHTGAYDFLTGTAANTVLAVGLDANAIWFGSRIAGLLMIQNGVDDPVAAQLGRSKTPGVWRKCGSNAYPAKPTVSLASPANTVNIPASIMVPGYSAFTVVDFGAANTINLPGRKIVTGTLLSDAGTTGTLPGGMAAVTNYWAYDCTYDAATNSTTCKLSSTDVATSTTAVNLTDAGIGDHRFFDPATFTGAENPFSVTLQSDYAAGSAGNGLVKMTLVGTSSPIAIYSTLSGTGTSGDPYHYTVYTGSSTNTVAQLVSFINSDSKVISFLFASAEITSVAPLLSFGPYTFGNGSGSGVSEGFTNKTVTVYLTYFDTGYNGYGYESPSSDITSEIYIAASAFNDVLVTITPDPTAEGGRFDKIRVYLQFGEGAAAIHNLMGDVANTAGTKTLQIGSNTEIGPALTEFDQHRPLPHKAVVAASGRTWRGALTADNYRDRLYVSKEATDDEKACEGVALDADAYQIIDVPDALVPVSIRSLYSDLFRLHVHTNAGIMVIDPANVATTPHRPSVTVGAINPSCFGMGPNNQIIYIGQDVQPYFFDGARYGRRNIKSAAREAEAIIRSVANLDTIGQNADEVTSFQDKAGMLWWFFPDTNGVIKGMCLDIDRSGMVGPFDYPKAVSSCAMESERPEIIIQDKDGNLFVYDVTAQNDTGADLTAVTTFSPTATTVPPTAGYAGFPYVDYDSQRYLKACWTVLETGHIDLGKPGSMKSFGGIKFRPVANSRGILVATFTGVTSGKTVTRTFGEIGEFTDMQAKQIMMQLSDTAVKLKVEILGAEGKPWIVRDVTLLYRG